MTRYFLKLAYRGTPFVGWQIQPNGPSVQQCLESSLSKLLNREIGIVGCGRTDAGVHASEYFAHFDWPGAPLTEVVKSRLNRLLPPEIAVSSLFAVSNDLHARYSAICRTYRYFITAKRDPFRQDLAYFFYYFHQLDLHKMQQAAELITRYEAFLPFCKSHSGVDHFKCHLSHSRWEEKEGELIYVISANRFLRGMVRLIVGMCLQVGLGKISLEAVKESLDHQKPLTKSLSAPPHGLFLTKVLYDFKAQSLEGDSVPFSQAI